jgi:hypothetical protein
MTTEALLSEVVSELRALRRELRSTSFDACDMAGTLEMLGLTNQRVLTYWAKQGILNRVKRGRDYIYYKSEVMRLAEQIRDGKITVPTQTQMRNDN